MDCDVLRRGRDVPGSPGLAHSSDACTLDEAGPENRRETVKSHVKSEIALGNRRY